jgi:hypothetical protein
MEIFLGDFNVKEGTEDIFMPRIGNIKSYEISNDTGVRAANFGTSKKFIKSTMLPCLNTHKYTWTSPDGKTCNQTDHILIDKNMAFKCS